MLKHVEEGFHSKSSHSFDKNSTSYSSQSASTTDFTLLGGFTQSPWFLDLSGVHANMLLKALSLYSWDNAVVVIFFQPLDTLSFIILMFIFKHTLNCFAPGPPEPSSSALLHTGCSQPCAWASTAPGGSKTSSEVYQSFDSNLARSPSPCRTCLGDRWALVERALALESSGPGFENWYCHLLSSSSLFPGL